ncbi:MAG: DUF364 domain-containing protein, partial [Oscillospiraceae bacterium]
MWELYDALIGGIPDSAPQVTAYKCGGHWGIVEAGEYAAGAMYVDESSISPMHPESFLGVSLHDMAGYIKSWNFAEASLGAAAINAWYNSPKNAMAQDIIAGKDKKERNAFFTYKEKIAGKKVAVVGHFPFLETQFAPVCSLSILERSPQRGDYPDTACEYLLPQQDYVFITGVTLTN